jgi:hypothetical protein
MMVFFASADSVLAYYAPEMGRFISRDPIGDRGEDKNLYRYVGNKPALATDPLGLSGVIGPIGPSSPGSPTTTKGDKQCKASVHCWPVIRYGITVGTHCGYTLDFNGTITHLDGSGSSPGEINTNSISSKTTFGPATPVPSSSCQCLLDYREKYKKAEIPRSSTAGNSNWMMGCMSKACGLSVNWHGNPPSFHDDPPCKRWKQVGGGTLPTCPPVCDEYYSCP